MASAIERLRRLLPAGEWTDLEEIPKQGMMATSYDALLARATWLRRGGVRAFVKCIWSAPRSAGATTQFVLGPKRLARLAERLGDLRDAGGDIPVVPILKVSLVDGGKALLLIMEAVVPLNEHMERVGADISLARDLIDRLYPSRGDRWHHFDVDPMNIGIKDETSIVLIDPDSLYLRTNGCFDITLPAWKQWRSPNALEDKIMNTIAEGLSPELAAEKQAYETLLAAAECSLGHPADFDYADSQTEGLEHWLDQRAEDNPELADFWRRHLIPLLSGGAIPAKSEVLAGLKIKVKERPQEADPMSADIRPAREVTEPDLANALAEPNSEDPFSSADSGKTDDVWKRLAVVRRAMRTRRLLPEQLVTYEEKLVAFCRDNRSSEDAWRELLLLRIAYKRDPSGALETATEAVAAIPGSKYLRQQVTLLELWVLRIQAGAPDV